MPRRLLLVTAVICSCSSAYAQQLTTLHIKVQLVDAAGQATPVPNHALLVGEEPPVGPPRRVITRGDGTADVKLRPGRYAVESDRPVAFQGRVYEWAQRITVGATADATLQLTAENATQTVSTSARTMETDPVFLLNRWQRSVVGVWTPLAHGAGSIVDARNGLIATNARLVGSASDVEAQITPDLKVRAHIVAADANRGVAILQVHPSVAESLPELPFDCAAPAGHPIAAGQELIAIAARRGAAKDLVVGDVERVDARGIGVDLRLPVASAGGPVFAAGRLIGITSDPASNADDDIKRWGPSHIVGADAVCAVLAAAQKMVRDGMPPDAARLPVDPASSVSTDLLTDIVRRRAGSLSPPQMSSTDFDVAFLTPVHTFAGQSSLFSGTRQRSGPGLVDVGSPALRAVRDFANWSEYVSDVLPVLLVRVTPKLAEGFWTTVARGAAQTQGVPLPPMKRAKSGFGRLRAFCGDTEVTPIHPFRIEQRVSESDLIYEGLYAFEAAALGPQCATVKLTLYSERQPDKGDTRQIDAAILQEVARDFATLRAAPPP